MQDCVWKDFYISMHSREEEAETFSKKNLQEKDLTSQTHMKTTQTLLLIWVNWVCGQVYYAELNALLPGQIAEYSWAARISCSF